MEGDTAAEEEEVGDYTELPVEAKVYVSNLPPYDVDGEHHAQCK